MRLDVMTSYFASVKVRNGRTFQVRPLSMVLPVEVVEMESSACPVALTYESNGREVVLRDVGGSLFARKNQGERDSDERAWLTAVAGAVPSYDGDTFGRARKLGAQGREEVLPETTRGLTVERSSRETEVARLLARVAEHAMLEGDLWTRVPEPVLSYDITTRNGDTSVASGFVTSTDTLRFQFGFGEVDQVEGFLRAIEPGRTRFVVETVPFRMTAPALFVHRTDVANMRRSGASLLAVMRDRALDADLDYVTRYVGLRDALAAVPVGFVALAPGSVQERALRDALEAANAVEGYLYSRFSLARYDLASARREAGLIEDEEDLSRLAGM